MSLERPELQSKYGQKRISEMNQFGTIKTQSKERKSILESQGRKLGRTGDSSIGKSPVGKITKNTYLTGLKGSAATRLTNKLNMSLNSVQSDDKRESRALISSPFKKPILQQKKEERNNDRSQKYTKIEKKPR